MEIQRLVVLTSDVPQHPSFSNLFLQLDASWQSPGCSHFLVRPRKPENLKQRKTVPWIERM
jgi:hypothetical protein